MRVPLYSIQELPTGKVSIMARPRGGDWLLDEIEDLRASAILDRSVPSFSDQTFLFLKQLRTRLSEGKHIAFHCRQGLGRSALMAASLLVLTGLTPEQAFGLLSRARRYTVPETQEQRAWVVALSQHQGQD